MLTLRCGEHRKTLGSGTAKKAQSRSSKAVLRFSVGRIVRFLKAGKYAERVGVGTPIFLVAVLEYLVAEDMQSSSQALSHRVSFSSNASDMEYPHKKSEPAYSFVGMHCIFDQCQAMVTVIKFGVFRSACLWSIGWKLNCLYATVSSEAVNRACKRCHRLY